MSPATSDLLSFEREAASSDASRIAGVDEAGRGPLAGPVVAAAFMADLAWLEAEAPRSLAGLNDSKQLTPASRDRFYALLTAPNPAVSWAAAVVPPDEIDRLNILRATHLGMARALSQLPSLPDLALVDGLPVRGLPCPHKAIVSGDASSLLIAAASVIAKVTRDRLMVEADALYPGYGFAAHKGYGTRAHLDALARLGPCPIHRRSFAPVSQLRLF
jgi:ribonuclease HII